MPRVKHHRKDANIDVRNISEEEHLELKEINKNDPYFKVGSKQEQEKLCIYIDESIVCYEEPRKVSKKDRDYTVKYKMKKNKIIYTEALYSMRNYEAALAY